MNGEERRTEILKAIQSSSVPLSGTELARRFQVSRQIIVQDIAILRAANHEILSTNRGYLLTRSRAATRVFKVSHSDCLLYTSKIRLRHGTVILIVLLLVPLFR